MIWLYEHITWVYVVDAHVRGDENSPGDTFFVVTHQKSKKPE
jgi:hypothetical protein